MSVAAAIITFIKHFRRTLRDTTLSIRLANFLPLLYYYVPSEGVKREKRRGLITRSRQMVTSAATSFS